MSDDSNQAEASFGVADPSRMKKRFLAVRLFALFILPLGGLAFFGIRSSLEKWRTVRDYVALEQNSAMLRSIGNVVHELQKERGRSQVFLVSGGVGFAAELREQRQSTDAALAQLNGLLRTFDGARFGPAFQAKLKAGMDAIGDLPARRSGISAVSLAAADSLAYFTQTISVLLEVVVAMSRLSKDADIADGISCYVNFVQAKEQAGIERAVLAGVFTADRFTGDSFDRLSRVLSAHDVFLRVFEGFASEEQRRFHAGKMRGPAVESAVRMRQAALEKAGTGGFGIAAGSWFDASTARINLMKEVEDRLAADHARNADAIKKGARREFVFFMLATLLITGFTVASGGWIVRSIYADALRAAAERTAALRESEERFRGVFEQSPLPIICATFPDGRILQINAAAEAAFGYPHAQVIGRTSAELGMWVDAAERERFLELMRTQGEVVDFEAEMRRHDGASFTVLLNANQVTFNGRPCGLTVVRDITGAKRAQAAVVSSEARLREAQRLSLIGNWELDLVADRLHWGEMIYVIFELDPQQFEATYEAFLGRVHPGDRELVDEAYTRSVREHAPYEIEHRLLLPDGRIKHVIERGVTEYAADGTPLRSSGTVQDITARKLGEEAAVRLARQFRDLFEFAPDAMVMADRAGAIVGMNRRAEALFGYPRAELLGQLIEVLVPEALRGMHQRDRTAYAAHLVPREMGQRLVPLSARRKDGSVFPAQISLGPLHTEDGLIIVAAVRDITAQRAAEEARLKAEAQFRHAHKMESLGTLAGGIAHDFNNILAGLLGCVELARLDLPVNHPARPWIEKIAASGARAKGLVKQILTFSRRHPGELVAVRLHPVVAEACDLVRSTIPAMVELERRISPDCPPVLADADQIHQVVVNLCTNAWHALPETGGRIVVELDAGALAPGEIAEMPPGPVVRLTVRDNGMGMNAATLERIFEPFYTTKPAGRGTGLGMAVVHGIVRGHSGAIRVESAEGKGTVVRIVFPAFAAAEAPLAVQSPEPGLSACPAQAGLPRGNGQSILLVDDEQIVGESLRLILERIGYRVTFKSDPREALELFRRDPKAFDLVLTDQAMPGLSGRQLTSQLLALRADLPVLLISGYIEPASQQALLAAGIRAIVRKPPVIAALAELLAQHLAPK